VSATGSSTSEVVALLCPVHGCGRPLTRGTTRVTCPRGHSFDVARSGYVNLLQPQERRSARPGDSADVLRARRRFHARGFEAPIVDAVVRMLTLARNDAALDVGCGDGHHLATLAARCDCEGHGIDISVAAIDTAARQYPALHWVVGNADRALPYADASFRAVTSITARRNPAEFRRVLHDDGALLVVIPAPDDLIELREAVLGERILRERVADAVQAFTPLFALERYERLRHVAHLDAPAIGEVMMGTYRALRTSQRARLQSLDELDVTLSRDALLFRPVAAQPRVRSRIP
jgi:23S rRNA (guanine745-N1)-methyltransferase